MLPALCCNFQLWAAENNSHVFTAPITSQAYIDNLKATGQVENAVISDLSTGEAWTGGLAVTAEEAWAISALRPPNRCASSLSTPSQSTPKILVLILLLPRMADYIKEVGY